MVSYCETRPLGGSSPDWRVLGCRGGARLRVGACGAERPPPCQVMAFPGLSPSREAFLTAAEFGTQELGRPAQLRLQVYRAGRGAGGTPSWQRDSGGVSGLSALLHLVDLLSTGLVSSLRVDTVGPGDASSCQACQGQWLWRGACWGRGRTGRGETLGAGDTGWQDPVS